MSKEAGQRSRSLVVASAGFLVLANLLTAYLMYPAFFTSSEGASVGVPLIIAFHLALGTDWLTNTAVRAGLLSFWWYVPPILLTLAALGRLGAMAS